MCRYRFRPLQSRQLRWKRDSSRVDRSRKNSCAHARVICNIQSDVSRFEVNRHINVSEAGCASVVARQEDHPAVSALDAPRTVVESDVVYIEETGASLTAKRDTS